MRIAFLAGWLAFAVSSALCAPGSSPRADDGLADRVVATDRPSAERAAAERGVTEALVELPGKLGKEPKFVVVRPRQGVLWGDLFRTGGCFAMVELPPSAVDADDFGVAFAEWTENAWKLRQVWKIGAVWRERGWKADGDDYLPITPASQPFVLEDFSGDGVPEVVIAGGVSKYFQENYLLRFLPKTSELKLVAVAMAKPERVGDFVRLYSNSGRRSIWEEWEFRKWVGEELGAVASWHSEVGYNEHDPTFSEGTRLGADGKPVTIRVLFGEGQEISSDRYKLTRNGESFGALRITWKDKEHPPEAADEIEERWLFEKITGLPRQFYPYPAREEMRPIARFEDVATAEVEGNAAAAKIFETGNRP